MLEFLAEAVEALRAHDADMLEHLAARAGTVQAATPQMPEARQSVEILRLQVAAARRHLKLYRNLCDSGDGKGYEWVR